MIDLGCVHGHDLAVLLDQPLGGIPGQSRRRSEILEPIGVFLVPPRYDNDDIAVLHSGLGGLQVFDRNDLKTLLGNAQDNAVAE